MRRLGDQSLGASQGERRWGLLALLVGLRPPAFLCWVLLVGSVHLTYKGSLGIPGSAAWFCTASCSTLLPPDLRCDLRLGGRALPFWIPAPPRPCLQCRTGASRLGRPCSCPWSRFSSSVVIAVTSSRVRDPLRLLPNIPPLQRPLEGGRLEKFIGQISLIRKHGGKPRPLECNLKSRNLQTE